MIKMMDRAVYVGTSKCFLNALKANCNFRRMFQKDVQGRYYDSMVRHITIVFARYIVLAWQHRCSSDDGTLDGLFYELCDEIHGLDWAVALQQLIELLKGVSSKTSKKITNLCNYGLTVYPYTSGAICRI